MFILSDEWMVFSRIIGVVISLPPQKIYGETCEFLLPEVKSLLKEKTTRSRGLLKECNFRIKCSRLGAFEELLMQSLDWHEMCAAGKVGLHYWKENEINFFLFLVFCSYKPDPETTDEPGSLFIPAVGSVKNRSCDFCSFVESKNIFSKPLHELRRTDVLRLATYTEEL